MKIGKVGDYMKKIVGIVVAMDEEYEAIANVMTATEKVQVYDLEFLKGKIKGRECILVKSGIGKVNAARATQVMLDKFAIEYVINTGAAGAVNSRLNVGDVVLGKHVVQHDFDITAFDHSKGYITGIGDNIQCNRDLIDEFDHIIKGLPERKYTIKLGVVATGDIFCTEPLMKDKIFAKFDADVVDMECGAIAQVCYLCDVPFMTIRCVSDSPNGNNASDFDENIDLASKRCANLVRDFLT